MEAFDITKQRTPHQSC